MLVLDFCKLNAKYCSYVNVVMKNMCEIKSNLLFLTNTKYCPFNVH